MDDGPDGRENENEYENEYDLQDTLLTKEKDKEERERVEGGHTTTDDRS